MQFVGLPGTEPDGRYCMADIAPLYDDRKQAFVSTDASRCNEILLTSDSAFDARQCA